MSSDVAPCDLPSGKGEMDRRGQADQLEDIVISVRNLSKRYEIYDHPQDRLKQFLAPRLQKLIGQAPKKYFRDFWAVNDISLEIKRGETVGIIGRNGGGKSTLLQLICGTLNLTAGSIQTRGRIAALLELGSGFNPEFTGRENVWLNASILGLHTEEIAGRFDEIVSFADIGEFIEQPVKTYSSGMLVRLAFSVIAHVNANILVIDEALAVGDVFFTQKCMRFLRNFMKSGTVLFVSHDTSSIKSLCDRVIWLEKGRVCMEGSPKEVCEKYIQAFYEDQQGKSDAKNVILNGNFGPRAPKADQRARLINSSNLRNDLKVFNFDPNAASFGKGGAQIYEAFLEDESGNPLAWIVGGETVTLRVFVRAYQDLDSPIVGFSVKDRLGQILFGDNTFLVYRETPFICKRGGGFRADFRFMMPILPVGHYSISTAVANGTQVAHEQHHWIHDAILIKSESTSVTSGLVGIPMMGVELTNIGL